MLNDTAKARKRRLIIGYKKRIQNLESIRKNMNIRKRGTVGIKISIKINRYKQEIRRLKDELGE